MVEKILLNSTVKNVQGTVGRIRVLMLRRKGLSISIKRQSKLNHDDGDKGYEYNEIIWLFVSL